MGCCGGRVKAAANKGLKTKPVQQSAAAQSSMTAPVSQGQGEGVSSIKNSWMLLPEEVLARVHTE